jgi:hypothetical protein
VRPISFFALALLAAPFLVRCASSHAALPAANADASATPVSPGAPGSPSSPADGGASFCERCELESGGIKVALPSNSELSGIAASAIHEGVFYVHNDSGDSPRFFAIDVTGALLATFEVTNATAIDWEDIAVGPCGSGSCVYLSDTGDNDKRRASYAVYRVTEPASLAGLSGTSTKVSSDPLLFRYADGSHDAEALLAHPKTGRLALVTKGDGSSSIYVFPEALTPNATMTLTATGSLTLPSGSPRITAGDFAPDGRGILLRTYSSVWFYAAAEGEAVEAILAGTPCSAPTALEAQGESLAWLRSGAGYVTLSEGQAMLHITHCSAR